MDRTKISQKIISTFCHEIEIVNFLSEDMSICQHMSIYHESGILVENRRMKLCGELSIHLNK